MFNGVLSNISKTVIFTVFSLIINFTKIKWMFIKVKENLKVNAPLHFVHGKVKRIQNTASRQHPACKVRRKLQCCLLMLIVSLFGHIAPNRDNCFSKYLTPPSPSFFAFYSTEIASTSFLPVGIWFFQNCSLWHTASTHFQHTFQMQRLPPVAASSCELLKNFIFWPDYFSWNSSSH